MPSLTIKCIESWKKYCPDYEIKEWNESNFNVNICAYTREAYECKKWAFVSDYARFWILYNYGGLYFDTDVELIKPIDDIVARGPFMGMERNIRLKKELKFYKGIEIASPGLGLGANPGLGLGANPGLGLYAEVIDYYNVEHFIDSNGKMNKETVVEKVSKILEKYPFKIWGNEAIIIENIYIYKKDFFCPLDYCTGVLNITSNTRSIHHYTASWQSEDERLNYKIFTRMKKMFGPYIGKGLGYLFTINLRRKNQNEIRISGG